MLTFLAVVALVAFVAWWWQERKLHERAVVLAHAACRRYQVQLLDQTVALDSRKLQRVQGQMRLSHRYCFEFSVSPMERREGSVEFVAGRVKEVALDIVLDADEAANPDSLS